MNKLVAIIAIVWGFAACTGAPKTKSKKPTKECELLIEPESYGKLPNESKIKHFFDFLNKQYLFNGNVLLYDNGNMFTASYGYADVPNELPLNENSVFQIASMSKPFAAVCVMQLMRAGKLKLTDSLNRFFDNWPYAGVTINHLLCHTSGIPEYMALGDMFWNDSMGYLNNQLALQLFYQSKQPCYFAPGTRHDYCNSNFMLLALIIEKVSGLSYPAYLQKNVFCPLGMSNTFVYTAQDSLMKQAVKGHYGRGHYIQDHYLNGVYGDKNIWSTTADLFKFYRGIFNPKFMPINYRKVMFATQVYHSRGQSDYARGWRKKVTESDTWIFHTGWWKGFRTNLFFNTSKPKCFIVLSNRLKAGTFANEMIAGFFEPRGIDQAYQYFLDSNRKISYDSFLHLKTNTKTDTSISN